MFKAIFQLIAAVFLLNVLFFVLAAILGLHYNGLIPWPYVFIFIFVLMLFKLLKVTKNKKTTSCNIWNMPKIDENHIEVKNAINTIENKNVVYSSEIKSDALETIITRIKNDEDFQKIVIDLNNFKNDELLKVKDYIELVKK